MKKIGKEDVYNGTVDEFHNFGIALNNKKTSTGRDKIEFIFTENCGEITLENNGACCLGHINLSKVVKNSYKQPEIDWDLLEHITRVAVRFLDDVLTYNMGLHPIEEQNKASEESRRIGLGITGLADLFMRMKIRYDSDEALKLTDKIMSFIKNISYQESAEIAKIKDVFPKFDLKKMLDSPFIKALSEDTIEMISKYGLRNISLLTIAPVGTGSILAGTTSGIEPLFAKKYLRRSESLKEKKFLMHDPSLRDIVKLFGDDLPDYVVGAYDIDPTYRVKLQGICQRNIDASISSTLNLPRDFSKDRLSELFKLGWKEGLKGITIYREGSREGILKIEEDDSIKKNGE
ncbi:hypothetical protein DRN98_07630 [Methanosarcinales archaeon]|nr:MAG: hypothetical protein DRN98_07630 [Methanosarcinales archaeon]